MLYFDAQRLRREAPPPSLNQSAARPSVTPSPPPRTVCGSSKRASCATRPSSSSSPPSVEGLRPGAGRHVPRRAQALASSGAALEYLGRKRASTLLGGRKGTSRLEAAHQAARHEHIHECDMFFSPLSTHPTVPTEADRDPPNSQNSNQRLSSGPVEPGGRSALGLGRRVLAQRRAAHLRSRT